MLLWIFIYKCSCSHMFSFLLSIHLGVEWLDHMVIVCLTFWGTMLMIFIQFQSNLKLKPQTWFKSHLCPSTPCVFMCVCERERERERLRQRNCGLDNPSLSLKSLLLRTGENKWTKTNESLSNSPLMLGNYMSILVAYAFLANLLLLMTISTSQVPDVKYDKKNLSCPFSSPFSSQNWQYTPQLLAEVPSPGDSLFIISHELTGNAYMVAMTNMVLQAPPHGPQIFFAIQIFSSSFVYHSRISAKQPQHITNWGANSQSLQLPVTAGVLSSLNQGCYGLSFQMFCL